MCVTVCTLRTTLIDICDKSACHAVINGAYVCDVGRAREKDWDKDRDWETDTLTFIHGIHLGHAALCIRSARPSECAAQSSSQYIFKMLPIPAYIITSQMVGVTPVPIWRTCVMMALMQMNYVECYSYSCWWESVAFFSLLPLWLQRVCYVSANTYSLYDRSASIRVVSWCWWWWWLW